MTEKNIILNDLSSWYDSEDIPNGKRKVIQAALKIFSEKGYDATSTSEIAELAGTSQATLFKYFKTKQDLLKFIIDPILENILPIYLGDFVDIVKSENKGLEYLVNFMVHDRFQFLVKNKETYLIVFSQLMINSDMQKQIIVFLQENLSNFLDRLFPILEMSGEMREDIDRLSVLKLVVSQIVFEFIGMYKFTEKPDPTHIDHDLDEIAKLIYHAISK
ncbi:TetR/AcrR family transcriptional regulator [Companilactobacillus metriopterae]|uniref:TetR/AcrR family transcriptional regulator n=1 Tax=Companilactobacillus metriopterae TaxID=1909267 RepID=UPI00100B0855|nr:TetR/AcrR family transcriptional regulator [Companilactobacillus metriopterae]